MEKTYKAGPIIIGYEHHNTLSIIRCFGQEYVHVDVILCGCNDSYISTSCYVRNLVYIDTPNELSDVLLNNFITSEKRLIISCADPISSEIDKHFSQLSDNFFFSNCGEQGKLTYYMNKEVQLGLASEVGFDIPETYRKESASFPCLIKPVESINGGKHIDVANSQEELSKALDHYRDSKTYTIEQFLVKDSEIVLAGLSYNGNVIIPGYIEKIREIAGGTTYSQVCSIDSLPSEIITRSESLIRKVNYTGLFGIELIRVGSKYYFIELNLRNDATTYSFVYGGVNLPYIYYQSVSDRDMQSPVPLQRTGYFSIVENRDFGFVTSSRISIEEWLDCLRESSCRYFADSEDKGPYRVIKRRMIDSYIRSKLSRIKHAIFRTEVAGVHAKGISTKNK